MILRLLSQGWKTVRADDWWAYKIPPLLVAIYAAFLRFDLPGGAWLKALAALAAIVMLAIYGYVLNDICDVETDRLAGRNNRMATVSAPGKTAGVAVPAIAALGIAWRLGDPVVQLLIAVNLLLPTLYSTPRVRLKSRGVWGALADAAGAHAVPMAIVIRAVTMEVSGGWVLQLFTVSAIGWTLCAGLRGIIVHQARDGIVDRQAGVTTFGGALDVRRLRLLVLGWLLPLELVSLATFLALVLPRAPVAAVVVVLWLVVEFVKVRRHWTLPLFEPSAHSRERYVPLASNDIYELWLPFGLGLQLAVLHPVAWLLLPAQTLLFLPNIRTRLLVVGRALAPTRGRRVSS